MLNHFKILNYLLLLYLFLLFLELLFYCGRTLPILGMLIHHILVIIFFLNQHWVLCRTVNTEYREVLRALFWNWDGQVHQVISAMFCHWAGELHGALFRHWAGKVLGALFRHWTWKVLGALLRQWASFTSWLSCIILNKNASSSGVLSHKVNGKNWRFRSIVLLMYACLKNFLVLLLVLLVVQSFNDCTESLKFLAARDVIRKKWPNLPWILWSTLLIISELGC